MEEKIKEMLLDLNPDIDFENCTHLVKSGAIDSFDISSIVIMLEEEFNVSIKASLITPDNFKSVETIVKMIEKTR